MRTVWFRLRPRAASIDLLLGSVLVAIAVCYPDLGDLLLVKGVDLVCASAKELARRR